MSFLTAKNEVAERSRDTSTAAKTRAGEWLNLTMQEMCAYNESWDWLEATDTLAIVASTQSYTISTAIGTDVAAIFDLRIETSGGWKLLTYTPSEFDALYPDPDLISGRPEGFTIWNGILILDRNPDANYTAQIRYYKTVADLSADGDTAPWPSRWDFVWLHGAMRYAWQFNNDNRFESAEESFHRGLRDMMAHQGRFRPRIVIGRRQFARPLGSPWPVNRFAWA